MIGQSATLLYNSAPVTSTHLLQHCSLQDTLQKIARPEDLPWIEKLYGDLAALRRTTASERGASLSIEPWWLKMKRNMRLILPMHANLLLLFFSKLNLAYLDTVRACMCVYVCVCMILCTGVHMCVCSINSYLNKSEVFLFWVLSYILQIYNI